MLRFADIMQGRKHIILIIALVANLWPAAVPAQDTIPRWEPHLSATTGFVGTSFGDSRLFTTIAPSLTFHPSSRWSLTGGFRVTADYGLDAHYMADPVRSLAPRRNGGTRAASAYVEAEYRASDRLWLAASLYHLGGQYAPLFGPANGSAFDLSLTALSAEAAYRFDGGSLLHLSFTVVRDNTGALPYLWWEQWHAGGWGAWESWNRWDGLNRYDRWF